MSKKRRVSAVKVFSSVGVMIALATGFFLGYYTSLHWLLAYLVGINLATFVLYGHDKWAAIKKWLRVPEKVLHGFALIGGTPSAFVGQKVFHHKTVKGKFRAVFWSLTVLQVSIITWVIWYWELWRINA